MCQRNKQKAFYTTLFCQTSQFSGHWSDELDTFSMIYFWGWMNGNNVYFMFMAMNG